MILVTVGTNEAPFERLLRALDALELGGELVVQTGSATTCPRGARCFPFLPFDDLRDLMRQAQSIVTHAGVGSVMVALSQGKRPVVVPRLERYGEAVDDHQLAFARRMHEMGLVTLAEGEQELRAALMARAQVGVPPRGSVLPEDLRMFLTRAVRG